jgi:hypothetical protein
VPACADVQSRRPPGRRDKRNLRGFALLRAPRTSGNGRRARRGKEASVWTVRDVDDISATVRALPQETARRIVRTTIGAQWCWDFLGLRPFTALLGQKDTEAIAAEVLGPGLRHLARPLAAATKDCPLITVVGGQAATRPARPTCAACERCAVPRGSASEVLR